MEKITYKDFYININNDEESTNPRTEWDNFGHMVCFHNRYNLGDKHNMSQEELKEIISKKDVISLPLYLYDHSGITINTVDFNCPWDSGMIGYIYVEYEEVKNEYSVKRITKKIKEKVINILRTEVEIYDYYITNDVYYYTIYDKFNNIVDSCCGFYGYDHEKSGLLQSAKSAINYEIENHDITKITDKEYKDTFYKIIDEYKPSDLISTNEDLYDILHEMFNEDIKNKLLAKQL